MHMCVTWLQWIKQNCVFFRLDKCKDVSSILFSFRIFSNALSHYTHCNHCRDHSGYELHCNIIFLWLSPSLEWSLYYGITWEYTFDIHQSHIENNFRNILQLNSNTIIPKIMGLLKTETIVKTCGCAVLFNKMTTLSQNGCHLTDDTFKHIFLNENVKILFEISLKLFLRVQLTIFHHWFR